MLAGDDVLETSSKGATSPATNASEALLRRLKKVMKSSCMGMS